MLWTKCVSVETEFESKCQRCRFERDTRLVGNRIEDNEERSSKRIVVSSLKIIESRCFRSAFAEFLNFKMITHKNFYILIFNGGSPPR